MPRKNKRVHPGPLSFGEWVNQRRLGLGLTQQNLARLVSCSEVWIKKIERGETPSEQTAEGLANALEVPTHLRSRFFRAALSGQAAELPPPTELHAPPAPKAPPPQPAKFFGRTRELGDIAEQLNDPWCRLLTLRGPGGVGKTRLALHALEQQRARWDAVCFVSLREIASPRLIPQALADALQLRLTDAEPAQQIAAYLREIFPKTLLLLDNFEHLLDGADLAHELLTRAPEIKILVTSREQLHLDWERIVDLEGLDFPRADETAELEKITAVELFIERARRAFPRFPVKAELADAARICRLVEGHPLALELAAAWVASFSCAEIAAQIETSIQALKKERLDATRAHASITAAFDYSYARLTTLEQETFRRLAFFEGGFERGAAEAVTQAPHNVLTALADKSLVQREGRRFDLHELLRRYALEKINAAAEESAATARRMFQYFLQYAQTRRDAYLELEKEWSNLNAGLRLAHAQQDYATAQAYVETLREPWERRGRYTDARQAYRLACEQAQASGDLRAYANDLCEWGKACVEQGDHQEAEEHLLASRACWYELDEIQQVGRVNVMLARIKKDTSHLDEADELLALAQPVLEASNDGAALAEFYYRKASIQYNRKRFPEAKKLLEKALQESLRLGQRNLEAQILSLYAYVVLYGYDDKSLAEQACQRAIILAEQLNNNAALIEALYYLSGIRHQLGKLPAARADAERAFELTKRVGDAKTHTRLLFRLSQLDLAQGDLDLALVRALESFARCGNDDIGRMYVASHVGNIYSHAHQVEQARSYWQEALELAHQFDSALATQLEKRLAKDYVEFNEPRMDS